MRPHGFRAAQSRESVALDAGIARQIRLDDVDFGEGGA
jgi:hypothetical protein